jgi:hypothetical protein
MRVLTKQGNGILLTADQLQCRFFHIIYRVGYRSLVNDDMMIHSQHNETSNQASNRLDACVHVTIYETPD